jgi:hypothetical protein
MADGLSGKLLVRARVVGCAELVPGADKSIINRAETLHETALAVIDSLKDYGVTPEKLEEFSERIKAFKAFRAAHPTPRQRVTESSAATKALKKLFREANVRVRERVDRLLLQFKNSAPEFLQWIQGGTGGGRSANCFGHSGKPRPSTPRP